MVRERERERRGEDPDPVCERVQDPWCVREDPVCETGTVEDPDPVCVREFRIRSEGECSEPRRQRARRGPTGCGVRARLAGSLLCNGVVNHALLLIAHHEGLALVRHLLLRLLDAVTRRIRLRAQPRDAAAAAAAATAASRDWVNRSQRGTRGSRQSDGRLAGGGKEGIESGLAGAPPARDRA